MPTWVAGAIVVIVGSLLAHWHFTGTQVLARGNKRSNKSFFDGDSGVIGDHHADSSHGGGGDSSGGGGNGGH